MKIATLIAKLREEQRKHGNIDVILHVHEGHSGDIVDVATFSNSIVHSEIRTDRVVWLSTQEAA